MEKASLVLHARTSGAPTEQKGTTAMIDPDEREKLAVELTADDRTAVCAFMILINDWGAWPMLERRAIKVYGPGKRVRKMLKKARQELSEQCGYEEDRGWDNPVGSPECVAAAAPSLRLLVKLFDNVGGIPGDGLGSVPKDLVPSGELVQKCVTAYFEGVRFRAGTSEHEGASDD